MSLRARLLVGMAVVAVVLVAAAFVITRNTRSYLVDQVDAQLRQASAPGRLPREVQGPEGGPELFSSLYVGLVAGDQVQTLFTPNVYDSDPAVPEVTAARAVAASRRGEVFTATSSTSGDEYRVLARADPRFGTVQVYALPLDDVDAAVGRLVTVEVIVTVLILGVLGVVTWWVIRLGVRPVKRMTATASAIAAGDLSQRVPDVAPGTEAGELGEALNQMLGRIEAAFDERTRSEARLRQFVADASHELRTPVTTIRGYAELYRAGGLEDERDLQSAMRRTEQEAVRMGVLVDDLLHLARLDQGSPLLQEPVDVAELVDDAVRDARATDPDRPITASRLDPATVTGDADRLRQVVANLVGNALVHTPPGTEIDVRLVVDDARVVLEVEDRGPGMSQAIAAARAFERFYRADPSRSRHRGGSGLGLAIVEATVVAHAGSVSLDSEPGRGTIVRVELPERDPARDDGAPGEGAPSSVGVGDQVVVRNDEPSGVEPSSG